MHTTWNQMVASNMIHCALLLMTTTITQAQTMLVYYLKANHPHIIENKFPSLTVLEDSTKTTETLWTNVCVPLNMILVLVLNELALPVMALVEQL